MGNDENILIEFTNFLEKSAVAMVAPIADAPEPVGVPQRVAPPNALSGTPAPEGGAGISKGPKPAAPLAKAKF
jgi:hypothetical protein